MEQVQNFYLSCLHRHNIFPYRLGLTFLLVAGLCSCDSVKIPDWKASNFSIGKNVTPIGEIKSTQDQKVTVYIQGKVEKQVPLVKRQAYQISDATGKIWVITNQLNFKAGESVVIKGKVRYQSIPLAGQEFGEVYIEEE